MANYQICSGCSKTTSYKTCHLCVLMVMVYGIHKRMDILIGNVD